MADVECKLRSSRTKCTKTPDVPGSGWLEASLGVLGVVLRLRLAAPPPHRTSSALQTSHSRSTSPRMRLQVLQGGRESCATLARVLRKQKRRQACPGG